MKKFWEKIKKLHYFHYINTFLTIGFILLTIFVFNDVFIRFKESFTDLWTSICYYFSKLFEFDTNVIPTVNNISVVPWKPLFGLPATWEEFVVLWNNYWVIWATSDNLKLYFVFLAELLYNLSRIILLVVVPLVLILVFHSFPSIPLRSLIFFFFKFSILFVLTT